MRNFLASLFLALGCLSAQATYTTTSLTITNTPTNGYTATINGKVLTWTNTVATASTQIQNTNAVGWCASNLFNQLLTFPISGVQVHSLGTNAVTFSSFSALTVSVSTNWATLTNTAITTTNGLTVIVPFTQYQATDAVTVASQLVSGIDANSTTAFSAASPTMVNFVNTSTDQSIGGVKTFTGTIAGNGFGITNMPSDNLRYGAMNATGYKANGNFVVSYFNGVTFFYATNGSAFQMYGIDGTSSFPAETTNNFGFYGNGLGLTNLSTNNVTGLTSVLFAMATDTASRATASGPTFTGTNTMDGQVAFVRKNITTLANGANSISASTNLYLKVSGPSGAFTINGIAGGTDGRLLIIQNSTGFTLTVANDSGTEPTAANRIYTGTGADITQANNPGCVTLIYDSAVSRWVVTGKN